MFKPLNARIVRVAALLFTFAASASAQTLFTDNFTVDSNQYDPNYQNTNGRQGGLLGVTNYVSRYPGQGNQQVGNTTSFNNSAGALLLANDGSVYLNYDFKQVSTPIKITFDIIINDSNNSTQWVSLNVLNSTSETNRVNECSAGILFRENGGTQTFNNGSGSDGVSLSHFGQNIYDTVSVVLSDTAGTGSAFGTGGSMLTYYEGNTRLGSFSVNQLTDGYIGFGCISLGGIDNLSISQVPEPSTWAMGALIAGALLWKVVRRRSAVPCV